MNTATLNAPKNTQNDASDWKDGKRWLWLMSPGIPFLGLAAFGLFFQTGWGALLWAGPLLIHFIVPVFDLLIGEDKVNAPESAVPKLIADNYYRWVVAAYIPSQYLITIIGAWLAVYGNLAWWELIGMAWSVGAINGVGINTAHELGHKKEKLERWLARITLAPVAYGHFYVEHNKGHHKNVATPEDPASSKMGETFWAFLPRTTIGSIKSAWSIEANRLERLSKPALSVHNEVLQSWAMTVVFFGALTIAFGPIALLFLVVQAMYGFTLLEVVNYIEHYGLLRQKTSSGRYERCQPHHSWNSNHMVTNLVLYQLQRHSDHHANPTREFQALRHFDDTPQLPSGYASMITLAYFPPLWFKVMDKRVAAHHGYDMMNANIHEPARERIMDKWHRSAHEDKVIEDAITIDENDVATEHGCTNCSYVYRDAEGCPDEGYPAGTAFSELPIDFPCPQCAVREKPDFVAISKAKQAA